MSTKKNMLHGFEDNMLRLEEISEALEKNELPLEEMLKLYEEGMGLAAKQSQILDSAKARIREITVKANGSVESAESDLE